MSMAADREEDSWLNPAEREDHDEYMAAKNRKKRATEMIDKIISAENIDDDVEVAARAVEILESLQDAFELLDAADNGLIFPETVAPLVVSFLITKKKKLSRKLVELIWKHVRGQAEGPDDAGVCRVMEKSKRQCGVKREQMGLETGTDALSKIEAQRICKAFMRKSNKTIDQLHPDVIFYYLDTNNDGVLDKSEVASAMKAMWLMSTDNIRVELLLDDYDQVL